MRPLGMALALLLFFGAGCTRSESEVRKPSQKIIGVTLLTVQHQFYQELRAGLEEEAVRHGYRLLISTAEFDSARQANQIDEFIVQKVDAMIVCPCDSRSVGASIVAANQANIPVFTADIASVSPLGKVAAHIASDNVAGGRAAARLLAKAIGDKGKVVVLSHPEVASVADRVRGFKEELAAHPNVQVVAELSSDGKRDKAVRVMEDLLQAYPDLSGVFGINDDTALGALAAIEAAGKLKQIKIVGYDATPEARAKIKAGQIYGDVIQDPRRIGVLTIQAIRDSFAGRKPPEVIPVEVGVFTGDSPP
ncbi:MAG TPA: substrate-binding domain-containing protein [Phycisphaerae bacterium]|nr:substrate-binding domain-containing protein [Phycisphaerae bacterium]